MVDLNRSQQFKNIKDYFPQILLGPFLNTFSEILDHRIPPETWLLKKSLSNYWLFNKQSVYKQL